MSMLSIRKLKKSFGQQVVFNNISFSVGEGEFTSILGVSGCGKTTLLRIIAGLEKCDHGQIFKDEEDITTAIASERKIGMVFQNYSLFPNMNVRENITYAIKCKNIMNTERKEFIDKIIESVNLGDLLKKFPYQLSGGQQQRTAIARTLVMKPEIVLLDEPFSALDFYLRQSLRELIMNLKEQLKMTVLYVTHDQEEAFTLSDQIVIMSKGEIEQEGTPKDIYSNPKGSYVKDFIYNLDKKYKSLESIILPT